MEMEIYFPQQLAVRARCSLNPYLNQFRCNQCRWLDVFDTALSVTKDKTAPLFPHLPSSHTTLGQMPVTIV